ncbi:uncharacterized protein PV09_04591 [Verruconis gallopava]|uniref:Uncharacterized protein n=1 Tax=Verruconis gallopava TaxID=253628 RepID=A0A0D2ACV5_9PEZI|nr:uncharacterized protein PV09_04591 [Verruconis gallopava]KIW04295.1 hypothetical protein PV09_04591 [Verruconis gallopava]
MEESLKFDDLSSIPIVDVLIIGAGPCGLATAARLREKYPSALFTDEEQSRYTWIARNAQQTSIKDRRTGRVRRMSCVPSRPNDPSILVLDSTGDQWMERWNKLFERLEIEYLRSPMFFHTHPQDRDALLSFCHREGSSSDWIQEIAGCVGKELSKHEKKKRRRSHHQRRTKLCPSDINERDRQDYFAPASLAFKRFCEECIEHYRLKDLVRKESVESIDYDFIPGTSTIKKLFIVRASARTYLSRIVVLAVGGGDAVSPVPFHESTHVLDLGNANALIPDVLKRKVELGHETNVLVVGGGLTSAQAADCLLRKGIAKVYLLMRGPWKTKPFDIDLEWMGRYRNGKRAAFWTEDDLDERLAMAKQARNGGSITPRFAKKLKKYEQEGRLKVYTHTQIVSRQYDERKMVWKAITEPRQELPYFDHIIFATGLSIDVRTMDILRTVNEKYPIPSHGGHPALTDDLRWNAEMPLFVNGKLAMLQLGPSAGNLEGARLGAERIAWGIFNELNETDGSVEQAGVAQQNYVLGIGSRYDSLIEIDTTVEI